MEFARHVLYGNLNWFEYIYTVIVYVMCWIFRFYQMIDSNQELLWSLDAKLLVDALNVLVLDDSSLGFLVEDCKYLAEGFQSCLFLFIDRRI